MDGGNVKPDDELMAWKRERAIDRIIGCRVMLAAHEGHGAYDKARWAHGQAVPCVDAGEGVEVVTPEYLEALREVDALCPGSEPIAPKDPAPYLPASTAYAPSRKPMYLMFGWRYAPLHGVYLGPDGKSVDEVFIESMAPWEQQRWFIENGKASLG